MTERHERRIVFGLVTLALLLRAGFALTLPAFQAPDERAHFEFVEHLVLHGTLPVQPELTPGQALVAWPQSYQPPLAYLSFAPAAALMRAAGLGAGDRLRGLRLQNALYGTLLVVVAFGVARRLRPAGHPLRVLAPLFVAVLPGLVGNAASLNNDGLANLLAAALFAVWAARPPGTRRAMLLGVLFGAACLTKLTVATLAPLLLILPWLERRSTRQALAEAALAGALALGALLPWLLRNLSVYGDPLAVGVGSFAFERLAGTLAPELLEQAQRPAPGKALLQLFGRFGVTNNLSFTPVPAIWLCLAVLGLAGWRLPGPDGGSDATRPLFVGFALALLLACIGLVAFSLRYYGAWQGRYLYVASLPLALLVCEGGARWLAGGLARRATMVLALLALLLVALDAALLWRLDGFFQHNPPRVWMERTRL